MDSYTHELQELSKELASKTGVEHSTVVKILEALGASNIPGLGEKSERITLSSLQKAFKTALVIVRQ